LSGTTRRCVVVAVVVVAGLVAVVEIGIKKKNKRGKEKGMGMELPIRSPSHMTSPKPPLEKMSPLL
jgi:hypothetical protein